MLGTWFVVSFHRVPLLLLKKEKTMEKNDRNPIRSRKYKIVFLVLLILGILLTITGIALFVWNLVLITSPEKEPNPVLGFLSVGILGVGIAMLMFSLIRPFSRYITSQAAPVQKDYVNYMREETKDSARKYYGDIASGIMEKKEEDKTVCPYCNHINPKEAKYCNHCGKELSMECPFCHKKNPIGSTYCSNCGEKLEQDQE